MLDGFLYATMLPIYLFSRPREQEKTADAKSQGKSKDFIKLSSP